jgi:ABC-type glutathione transport system ATPase component
MSTPATGDRPSDRAELLRMRLRKTFPGVVALGGADIDLPAGEVHVLLGEKGTGKSTRSRRSGGLSMSTLNNPFLVQPKAGTPHQIRHCISQNCRAIIINPVDSDAAAPSVKYGRQGRHPGGGRRQTVKDADTASMLASLSIAVGPVTVVDEENVMPFWS